MIDNFKVKGTWRDVANSARTTIRLKHKEGKVSDTWKKRILLSEHSPIRQLIYKWKWVDLMYYISTHFVRSYVGITHWVTTSRTDRTGIDRKNLIQSSPVDHECEANVQALINISRKRLCSQASPETRKAWEDLALKIKEEDEVLYSVLVPECIYRGFCPEFKPCGYTTTEAFKEKLIEYRSVKN